MVLHRLVVDNASTDETSSVALSFADTCNLELVREETVGIPYARNAGVAHCTGDVVAFLDDDCEAAPGWLAALEVPFLKDPNVGAVGGEGSRAARPTRGRKREGGMRERCWSVSWVSALGAFCCNTSASSETRARMAGRVCGAGASAARKASAKRSIPYILLRPGERSIAVPNTLIPSNFQCGQAAPAIFSVISLASPLRVWYSDRVAEFEDLCAPTP